jgi:hypothetical protein
MAFGTNRRRSRRQRSSAKADALFGVMALTVRVSASGVLPGATNPERPGKPDRSSLLFGGPWDQTPFSVLSPATRAKCLALFVTKVSPNDRACAAIRVSNVPRGSPRRASEAATRPNRSAACGSRGSTATASTNVSIRRCSFRDRRLSAPNRSSASVMGGPTTAREQITPGG